MANQFSIEEATGGATPPPSNSFSADEALAESTPVSTPKTTAALNETETLSQQLGRVVPAAWETVKRNAAPAGDRILSELHKPSPPWLQPFERSVKNVATTPFLPSAQDVQALARGVGLPDQPAAGSHLVETMYDPVRKAATLENAAVAASWIQPEIGAAITSAYLAPSVVPAAKQIKRLPEMTPEEGLQLGMEIWPIVAAPFIHGPQPTFKPSEFTGFPNDPFVPPDVPPTAAEAMKVKGTNVAPDFTAQDQQTQKVLSKTGATYSDQNLAEHFPNHELDDLQQMGVISDAGNGYFTVNPPGTKPAPPEPQAAAVAEPAQSQPSEPVKSQKELDDEHQIRLEEVENRLAIYGVKPINTEGMTTEEAMKVLETQEDAIPYSERLGSIQSGKTLQENRIARQLQNQWLEQRKGTMGTTDLNKLAYSIPQFDVTREPGGGFRVRTSPYEEGVEVPTEGTGKFGRPARPVIQRQTVPAADFFLDREGGELQPYASRVRSTTTVGVRGQGEKVGESPPLRQQRPTPGATTSGTQPKPDSERPVAPETPKETVPTRYVVRETNKGAVIRDLETNKVVGKQDDFQSSSLHPTPAQLAELRQRAHQHAERLQERVAEEFKKAAKESEPPKEEEAAPETTFRVRAPKDEFASSPTTPVATAVSDLGGILSRNTAKKRGRFEGNEALWNDLPKLADISHNKIYQQSGEMPDVMAQSLYDRGLISEPTVGEMYRSLEAESQGTRGRAKAEKASAASRNVMEKQAERFGREQRKEADEGTAAIPASALKVGDTVKVGDTKLKVTEIDPQEHLVTLENGKKYGIQEVNDDDVIFGEHNPEQKAAPKIEPPPAAAAAAPKQPPPGISAEPVNLPPATAGKGRIWQRRQSDPMRYQHRDEPNLWLELNKDKGGYDVVDYRSGQRKVFDFIGGTDARAKAQSRWSHGHVPTETALEPELSHISDFEREIKNKFGRDLTTEEKQKLAPIIKEINDARGKAEKAVEQQLAKAIDHYKDVKDISFDDAMKGIEDAITQALKDCGT